jgi:hypothetical protein
MLDEKMRVRDDAPARGGLLSILSSLAAAARYNAKLVFANKFIYFLIAAVVIFLLVVIIYAASEEIPPGAEAVYYFLLVPGVLLIFYPSTYSIQSDVDAGMLETLFGIPNYRYKIWLVRVLVQYLTVAALLALLALFCRAVLADFNIISMVFQLMFPIVFLGSLAFAIATTVRSGNATAAVMVGIGLFFWIAAEPLSGSRWNLFHNPFSLKEDLDALVWAQTTLYNRAYLAVGSILCIMYALLKLQRREKFI